MQDITTSVTLVADRIHELRSKQDRTVVGIAGAPGSGKSTLAKEIARRLNVQQCPTVVVPMDGFHLDNSILDDMGLRNRKGAPETFDVRGFVHLIKRLQARDHVFAPAFDRTRDLSVAGAVDVPPDLPVVLVEGNYLMFDEPVWNVLPGIWDLSVRLDVPITELRARLIQRWLNQNLSRAAATRRAESNDIPNANRIIAKALPCDITV
jgi:pantothenate kinase